MVNIFGGYVEAHGDRYFCTLCHRCFFGKTAIYSHCRNTAHHEWCEKCARVFVSLKSKEEHLENSLSHHICFECDDEPDFKDEDELESHLETVHFWCAECNECHDSQSQLRAHVISDHHGCQTCFRCFDSENNLQQHMIGHQPRTIECPGCDRAYARFSHLVLHLERSSCATVKRLYPLVFQSLRRDDYALSLRDEEPFYCKCCQRAFVYLSSLYQHVEDTPECSALLQPRRTLDMLKAFIVHNIH